MEDLLLQRVRDVLREKRVSMLQVSDACGIKQNTFSRQLSGESALSASTLLSIIGYFPDVSTEWLLRGKGNMLIEEGKENDDDLQELTLIVDKNGYLRLKQ